MREFSLLIGDWYRLNGRKLPWRETTDPYRIWLSEVILQQTRVEQGMSYYHTFVEHYPTVLDLANAREQDVLNDWQGLGYYSRARNLHAAAQFIRDELQGKFPDNYHDLRALKGVGDYTAAAIASIAYKEAKAVVDGNVYRLLSRCFDLDTPIDTGKGKREFQLLADELLNPRDPGNHNQAMMELGATICTPKASCEQCPLRVLCLAYARNTVAGRPVKSRRTAVRDRYFHFLIYQKDGSTWLEQRKTKDIWQHLYQFPLLEQTDENASAVEEVLRTAHAQSEEIIHLLSHQRIHARFYRIHAAPDSPGENWLHVPNLDLQEYPIPRLIDRYLEKNPLD